MGTTQDTPTIVLLGNVDHEGIISTIKTSRYLYRKKILDSTRENWGTIIELLKSPDVAAVIAKFTSPVYDLLDNPAYDWVADELFGALSAKRTMIFAYEILMDPDAIHNPEDQDEDEEGYRYYHGRGDPPTAMTREAVNKRLQKYGLQVISYSSNAELTVMASQFLREIASNLLFRLYVPHGRLYASEMDKLIQLFKDYLDRTGRRGISLNKVDAEHGTSYEFCGTEEKTSLAADFADFSQFMDLCVTDTERAQEMLSLKAIDPRLVGSIVDRYSKEARRLSLDISHERESKIMGIRHRLESELTDLPGNLPASLIRELVDETVPAQPGLSSLQARLPFGQFANVRSVTVNVNSQVIENAKGIIAREISGAIDLGAEGLELSRFIREHGGPESSDLAADLQQVIDEGIPESIRLTKIQRIRSLCYSLAPELARSGVHLLEDFLKSKMGLR